MLPAFVLPHHGNVLLVRWWVTVVGQRKHAGNPSIVQSPQPTQHCVSLFTSKLRYSQNADEDWQLDGGDYFWNQRAEHDRNEETSMFAGGHGAACHFVRQHGRNCRFIREQVMKRFCHGQCTHQFAAGPFLLGLSFALEQTISIQSFSSDGLDNTLLYECVLLHDCDTTFDCHYKTRLLYCSDTATSRVIEASSVSSIGPNQPEVGDITTRRTRPRRAEARRGRGRVHSALRLQLFHTPYT